MVFEHQEGCPARNVWTLLSVCCGACAASWRRWFTTGVPGPSLPVRVRCRCRASRVPAQRQRGDVSSPFPACVRGITSLPRCGSQHRCPLVDACRTIVPPGTCARSGRHAIRAPRNSGFRRSLCGQTLHTYNGLPVSRDRKPLTRISGCGVLDAMSIGKGMCGKAV